MFSESFPQIWGITKGMKVIAAAWLQPEGNAHRGWVFLRGKISSSLPSLAELRNKQLPFVWFWLTQNCLSFKNKPMFVSVIFAVWNPLLNSVRRKWDHWHPFSYWSFFTNSGQLCSELYFKGAPHLPGSCYGRGDKMLPSCLREVFWCPSLPGLLFTRDD